LICVAAIRVDEEENLQNYLGGGLVRGGRKGGQAGARAPP